MHPPTRPGHAGRLDHLQALLRLTLLVGALYDTAFACLMLAAPNLPARLLHLPLPPLPEAAFYLWILAILLLMLAALYLLAAHDIRRYSGIAGIAAAGRILGGVALLIAWHRTGLTGLLPLAAADLAFGLAHTALWWPIRL